MLMGEPKAESTDYALVSSKANLTPICATSKTTCEEAVLAIKKNYLSWDKRYDTCKPKPFCRNPAKDCIKGFDCPGGEIKQ